MFLMLPMTSVSSPHRIESIIDIVNLISNSILEDTCPDYTMYELNLRSSFMKTEGSHKSD